MSMLSDNIRLLRRKRSLTQQQLADDLIITRDCLSAYECARNEPPIQTLNRMSKYFKKSIDELINGAGSKFEDLDSDTQSIIEAMCLKMGWSKEKSILALVEFGMLGMLAAIDKKRSSAIMENVYSTVNKDEKLIETAKVYRAVWSV